MVQRLAADLALRRVRLERFNPPKVPFVAVVEGCLDPIADTRLLAVAWEALDFKHVHAVAVRAGEDRFV